MSVGAGRGRCQFGRLFWTDTVGLGNREGAQGDHRIISHILQFLFTQFLPWDVRSLKEIVPCDKNDRKVGFKS